MICKRLVAATLLCAATLSITNALAGANDYAFEPVKAEVKNGAAATCLFVSFTSPRANLLRGH